MHTTPVSLLKRLGNTPEQSDWQRFVNLYTPLLFFWARRAGLNQHDAEDLVQDVFATLLKGLAEFQYDSKRSFRGWLRTVTLNKWRDRERRKRRRPATVGLEQHDLESAGSTMFHEPEDLSEQEYRQHLLGRAMELVEPEFQETTWSAFQKTTVHGKSPKDVAAELGISTNAVYISRTRVMKRLNEELDGLLD